MKQAYISKKFTPKSIDLIATISSILNEYIRAGYGITVRSLYYQLVARGVIPNTERSYKSITNLVSDARMAGLLDWEAIEDRMRVVSTRARWGSGKEILESSAAHFHMDMWEDQPKRVFCVIEKDALSGIVSGTCHKYDVPMLAARGYPSSSVIRELVKHTMIPAAQEGQDIVILHLGDHDPSGIDMSRDLEERVTLFSEGEFQVEFRRLALNMDQINDQKPPPNPAKMTDSRFDTYEQLYGQMSWELDALSPKYTNDLLAGEIKTLIEPEEWAAREAQIESVKKTLRDLAEKFVD